MISSNKRLQREFPELLIELEEFSRSQNIAIQDYAFYRAEKSENGIITNAAWYPVDFDFTHSGPRKTYNWIAYEHGIGFQLVSE